MTDQESIMYYAARDIWHKRDAYTPGKGIKWRQWFQIKYGENIDSYAKRMERK